MSKKTEALVTKGAKLKEEIAKLTADLKNVEGQLIESGAGAYVNPEGKKATVVAATESFGFPRSADGIAKVEEIVGAHKAKLLTKVTTYKPVKNLLDVAKALLPKKDLTKLEALCTSQKTAYVIWA